MSYDELTTGLSEQNNQALFVGPMFVGGDSMDMEEFIEEVWQKPVTDENLLEVVKAFKAWYREVAPGEYHPPRKTLSMMLNDGDVPAPWEMPGFPFGE